MRPDETHLEYVQRIGAPRVVPCDVELGGYGGFVWRCRTHDYNFSDRPRTLGVMFDRCPMSRLEEWRAKRWDAA